MSAQASIGVWGLPQETWARGRHQLGREEGERSQRLRWKRRLPICVEHLPSRLRAPPQKVRLAGTPGTSSADVVYSGPASRIHLLL